MKRNVVLHGRLKKLFGGPFLFEVETAAEALRALNANFGTPFLEALKEGSYRVIRGTRKSGTDLTLEEVCGFRVGSAEIHLVPVAEGAKRGGGGGMKAILGVALVGVAIFASGGALAAAVGPGLLSGVTWGNVAIFGAAMALAGVSQMLSPKEKPKEETKRDDSFAFSGPANMNEQGNAVPLIYGEVIVGSIPISAGIDIEDYSAYSDRPVEGGPGVGG